MPTYGYDCIRCGAFDLVRPMAQAGAPAPCPGCGEPGRRTWGAPALRSLDPALTRALDASARTAEAPGVGVGDRVPSRRPRLHVRPAAPAVAAPLSTAPCPVLDMRLAVSRPGREGLREACAKLFGLLREWPGRGAAW